MRPPGKPTRSALVDLHRAVVSYHEAHGALPESAACVATEDTGGEGDVEPFFRASRAAALLGANASAEGARKALSELGLAFPAAVEIPIQDLGSEATYAAKLPRHEVVVKVSDPPIPHKTEVGAVRMLPAATRLDLVAFAKQMVEEAGIEVRAVRVEEYVESPSAGEAVLGAVWDEEFGPVVSFGEGGGLTELRRSTVRWLPAPEFTARDIERLIRTLPLAQYWFEGYRGGPPLASAQALAETLHRFGMMVWLFNERAEGEVIRDLEINPLALRYDGPVALDLLIKLRDRPVNNVTRPDLAQLARVMHDAKRVVVVGPSTTDPNNLGRVLYERLLREFSGEALAVNPNGGEIAGRRVFRSLEEVKQAAGPPDLTVFAVPAKHTASAMREALNTFGSDAGIPLIVASGFDETEAGGHGAAQLREVVRGYGSIPVLGPNTMALYSNTGSPGDIQVDFLPADRMTVPSFADPARNNLALVVQSGARFVAFLDKADTVGFRWAVLVGNSYQTDVADGVELAAADPAVAVVSIYVEGFGPGAGGRFAEAVRKCTQVGKVVVVQKVGKTETGADTARSHTASMSGSYDVFRSAMEQAGAIIADTDTDFIDITVLASLMAGREPAGNRVFVINSAGYEGVLAADEAAARGLELPQPRAMQNPAAVTDLLHAHLRGTIDCDNNPADVGPTTPDRAYAEVVEAALADQVYDMALIAITPHGNGMIGVLPPYEGEAKIGPLLVELWGRTSKPLVVSINGGSRYRGLSRYIGENGIPVMEEAERAVRALAKWANQRLRFAREQRSSG
jgi:3-hydroxypropionyl-CoA synthetase (ADP-forming)